MCHHIRYLLVLDSQVALDLVKIKNFIANLQVCVVGHVDAEPVHVGGERRPHDLPLTVDRPHLVARLPDGDSRTFRIVCVWPFGLLEYGSASLRCKS